MLFLSQAFSCQHGLQRHLSDFRETRVYGFWPTQQAPPLHLLLCCYWDWRLVMKKKSTESSREVGIHFIVDSSKYVNTYWQQLYLFLFVSQFFPSGLYKVMYANIISRSKTHLINICVFDLMGIMWVFVQTADSRVSELHHHGALKPNCFG